jgi:hypothetical protein
MVIRQAAVKRAAKGSAIYPTVILYFIFTDMLYTGHGSQQGNGVHYTPRVEEQRPTAGEQRPESPHLHGPRALGRGVEAECVKANKSGRDW